MATGSDEYLAVLKASYDYEPQSEDEIAIKENQLLFLLERVDDDWWKVKVKGESQEDDSPIGLVPAAYVEPADHTSVVKALYDYEANAPGELSVKEDEILHVFDKEDDWLLVQSQSEGGKAGFVPGNYVEESTGADQPPAAVSPPAIVIPPSPVRPVSTYVDPADRVASAKVKADAKKPDNVKTWAISEVDKKGKKKKGTLGVGNGAVFFASESDKTPVQKWQTADIESINVEKYKHVYIDIGGSAPINLHFNVGSKDNADAIISKLNSSKEIATSAQEEDEPEPTPTSSTKSLKKNASVHFSPASPAIIPPREASSDEDEPEPEQEPEPDPEEESVAHDGGGESAIALYDFAADGEDELSVKENELLVVLERDGDEWWKCRNVDGLEGVVPASYLEPAAGKWSENSAAVSATADEPEDDGEAEREAEAQAQAERQAKEQAEQAAKQRKEKEQKKLEADRRAKAAAAAAESERKRKQKEKEQADAEARKRRGEAEAERSRSARPSGEASTSSRASADSKRGPPPDRTRVWHDRTGQFRVEAAFLGFSNGKLRLHKVNGVIIEVPSEKMSAEDMRYVEKATSKRPTPTPNGSSDDESLADRRKSLPARSKTAPPPQKKRPTIDWFEFFLSAGCDVDDCTRYASSFERDKIDEAILPDITDATMRSLGLREGDIIRVTKLISQRKPQPPKDAAVQEQLRRDEEYARQLQGESRAASTASPPRQVGLFAAPDGTLKPRRGRPQPSKSLPPSNVDLSSIDPAQIKRTDSPKVGSPEALAPVQPPSRTSSAVPSGFDDDAWTNRPSSTKPTVASPPATAPTAPPAPATPTPAPPAPPTPAAAPAPPPQQPQRTGSSLAKTTESDIFDQLSRLSELRTRSPAMSPPAATVSAPPMSAPPSQYQAGMGMGNSPSPIGQLAQNQPPVNGPRGPFAPVPANQSLLQPLIPTTTGFNNFVPTRPSSSVSPFANPPSFLSSQPTGFPGPSPMMPQNTGFPQSGPLMSQPTGMLNGGFGQGSMFQNQGGFGGIQPNPTGFNPGFGQMPYGNGMSSPPPVPPLPSAVQNNNNTSPDNIFAQMKSGTFGGDDNLNPQPANKYDALRPNPLTAQPTGWGYQGGNGFQGGYGGYH